MYCPNCGKKLNDDQDLCLNCGKLVNNNTSNPYHANYNYSSTNSFIWAILGFLVPFVGIVLYFTWRDTKVEDAKKAGLGALIAIGLYLVSVIFSVVFAVSLY